MRFIHSFLKSKFAHQPNLISIIENISWLFFDKVLRMGVGLLVGVWVARYLGPEQFGLLNFSLAFIGLFASISSLGLQSIVIRNIVRDPAIAKITLGTAAFLLMCAGVVTYLIALAVISYLRPEDALARSIVAILGSIMLLEVSKISIYWFESQVQSKYIVWVQNFVFFIFSIIKIILIMNNAHINSFVWAMLAESILSALMIIIVMSRKGIAFTELKINFNLAKKLLKDCWPLVFSALAISIYVKIDQIMLGQMMGDEAVGIYSAAARISEVWYFIPLIIVASVFPTILKSKQINEVQYYLRLQKLYNLMSVLSVCIAIIMTFVSETIVTLLYGENYRASGSILSIHIWAAIPVFLGVASSNWFIAENMQISLMLKALIGAITNILLNLFLIPIYGVLGAALATLVSYSIADIFYDAFFKKLRKQFIMKIKSLSFYWIFYEKNIKRIPD